MDLLSNRELAELGERIGFAFSEEEYESARERLKTAEQHWRSLPAPPDHEPISPVDGKADPLNPYITRCDTESTTNGPLSGLAVGIKDNIAVAGVPMTCGLRAFRAIEPRRHATAVTRLLAAGATIAGKTNMDALAYGPTSETSDYGLVRNPVDENHVAGGSSSGSAAAVAAGDVDVALGTDTGGSVRIPAAFCGAVGFKPTWGAIPRGGVVDLSPLLDHIGLLGRDIDAVGTAFEVIVGPHNADPASFSASRLAETDPKPVESWTMGLPEPFVGDHVSVGVRERFETVVAGLEEAGATIDWTPLDLSNAVSAWRTITNTELAAAMLARGVPVGHRRGFDPNWYERAATALAGRAETLGPIIWNAVLEGTAVLERQNGVPYGRAHHARSQLRAALDAAVDEYDALLSPTMPVTAPRFGEWSADEYGSNVPLAYNTRPANLAGLPALSVPVGRVDGLPVGVQFIGSRYDDRLLLEMGRAFTAAR